VSAAAPQPSSVTTIAVTPPSSPSSPAQTTTIGGVSLAQLDALSKARRVVTFVNRPFRKTKAEVNARLGTVRFEEPVGQLVDVTVKAKRFAKVVYPPRVRLTVAYEDGPDARQAVENIGQDGNLPPVARGSGESQYRYTYLAGRDAAGNVVQLNPSLVDGAGAATLFPQVVADESFRLFVTLDGRSNQSQLDARANEIATKLLVGEDDLPGEEGEAATFLDITPSSVIGRVRWEAGPGVARTSWSVNNVAASKATVAAKIGAAVAKVGFTELREPEDRVFIDHASARRRL